MSITGQTHCDPCQKYKQGFVIVLKHRTFNYVNTVSLPEIGSYKRANMTTVKFDWVNQYSSCDFLQECTYSVPSGDRDISGSCVFKRPSQHGTKHTKSGILEMSVELSWMPAVHRSLTLGTLIDFIILKKKVLVDLILIFPNR